MKIFPSESVTTDFGKIAFEKHIEFCNFSQSRLGQRMATWDELGDKLQDEWRQVAKTVIKSFAESAVKNVC